MSSSCRNTVLALKPAEACELLVLVNAVVDANHLLCPL